MSTQHINLVGVVEDGSNPRDPNLPTNTAITILLPQFAAVTVDVLVYTAAGAPVDLTALAPNAPVGTLTLQRALDPCQRIPELRAVGGWAGAPNPKNLLRFGILARDTRPLALGRFFFDVWLMLKAGPFLGSWQIVGVSQAVLQAALLRA